MVAIFAGIHGYLDDIPTAQVPRFQEELREHLRSEGVVYEAIRESGDLSDELRRPTSRRSRGSRTRFIVQEETGLVGAPGAGSTAASPA